MLNKTSEILESINSDKLFLDDEQKKKLDINGYLVFENSNYMKTNLVTLQKISRELIDKEGDKGGWEGKEKYFKEGKKFESGAQRLGGLVGKHKVFLGLITMPEILNSAYHVVKDEIKICGLNLRNPVKDMGEQSVHIDGFPRTGAKEDYAGIVAFIYLDDCKVSNGAMRLIPKSHTILGWPDDHVDINQKHPNEIRIIVKAGTIVVANLNIWHAGAKNISGNSRRVIMMNIKNRKYDQLLNYKKFLDNDQTISLSEEEKYLLAVRAEDSDQKIDSGGSANELRREYLAKKNQKFQSVANNK
jgi:hypothetical protein